MEDISKVASFSEVSPLTESNALWVSGAFRGENKYIK